MSSRPGTKHRINLGDAVRARIAQLIYQLVNEATPEQWRESSIINPKLMVYCKTSDFFARFYPDQNKASGHWHNDRTILIDQLGILEDHRLQTKGAKQLHFTLSLWSKQPQKNVEKFNQLWQEKLKAIPPAIKHNLPNNSYILITLDLLPTELNTLLASVQTALAAQPILLIIDNIETITDQDRLLAFLQELPATVTIILTSHTKLGLGTLISLSGLDHRHSRQQIEHIATKKN
jgi:Effector-associated domain 4